MENPYQAPSSPVEVASRYGRFTFDECLAGPWGVIVRHWGMLALSTIVMWVGLMLGGLVLVIGWIFFLPAFAHGLTRFYLNALDGRVELGDMFSGFQDYWENTWRMLTFVVLITVMSMLAALPQLLGTFLENAPLMIIGVVLQYPFTYLVVVRFYLAPFFIVEQKTSATDAMALSWQVTSPQWLLVAALALVSQIFQGLGFLACGVGILVSIPYGYLMFVSAYRQIVGPVSVEGGEAPSELEP